MLEKTVEAIGLQKEEKTRLQCSLGSAGNPLLAICSSHREKMKLISEFFSSPQEALQITKWVHNTTASCKDEL